MRIARIAVCLLALPLLGGCIARAVVGVATLPVKVASKTVDLATTSQSEADEKRGRDMRRQEERLGRLDRDYQRHSRQCADGNERACTQAEAEHAELDRQDADAPALR